MAIQKPRKSDHARENGKGALTKAGDKQRIKGKGPGPVRDKPHQKDNLEQCAIEWIAAELGNQGWHKQDQS